MQRRYNHRNKNQKKIIIVSLIGLLFIMSAGYAAFSTNLNITAKGTISEKPYTIAQLKSKYCGKTSADGLYVDTYANCNSSTYENCRCIYRGTNPNNYIQFSGSLWRMVSLESDNTVKIIKQDNIGFHNYNDTDNNDWSSSTLNSYLNNEYYNTLGSSNKIATNKTFYTGPIETAYDDKSILEVQNAEKQKTWIGNIALLNFSDYIKASTNEGCKTFTNSRPLNDINDTPCAKNNFLHIVDKDGSWLLNGHGASKAYIVWNVVLNESVVHNISYSDVTDSTQVVVNPVLYLKDNITLKGKGTLDSPYTLEN